MESMEKKKAKRTPPPPSPSADGAGAGDDRISALDDDLCVLILRLAHLNVRELVRTSVLSKRWRGLWKRVPVLDFFGWPRLESPSDAQQYIAIVNDVLEQRARAASEARIDEVKIPLLLDAYSDRRLLTPSLEAVEAWIRYAMHHQVKGFRLDLRYMPIIVKWSPVMDLNELLPPSSPRLECLRLGLSDTIKVRLPRTAVFTSLKNLTLEFVEISAGNLLGRLLSAACCPSLQKLRMTSVTFVGRAWTKELVLDAGELLELSMECVDEIELLELRTPKLLHLEINECEHVESLRVSAPGLKELTYLHNRAIMHDPLPCVWRLKIDLFSHMEEDVDYDKDPNSCSTCLLKHCSSSVRCLLVHLDVQLEIHRRVHLIQDKIPHLPKVTSLLVSIPVECERHSFGDGVASLLTKFKNLEYLSLWLEDSPNMWLKKDDYFSDDSDIDSAFTCNHSDHWELSNISSANLREADFRGMTVTGCELRFLRSVLASATDLQSVTVSFNPYFIEKEEEEVQDSRMHYFVHTLLRDGTWTACEDKPNKCSKLYKWTSSP